MPDLSQARTGPALSESVWLRSVAPACRWVLRGGEAVRAEAEAALSLSVPAEACRAGVCGDRAALWLGPDEWLLVAPLAQAGLATRLERALSPHPHSLVDVSHRQVALVVRGAAATTLLASGCPLDLALAAFPVGMCTRTMLAKAEVVLWRLAEQQFRIEVWRSFAPYLSQYLDEAARGIN